MEGESWGELGRDSRSMEGESWRELGREELEHQYSPSHWSPRMDKDSVIEAHVRETAEGTRAARARTQTSLNISYGDSESEKLDMYLPQGQPTEFPLLIYIHGGYWQFLRSAAHQPGMNPGWEGKRNGACQSKEESGFMVPPLASLGIAVMVMDYDLAPKGHMDLIVSQVRRSIAVTLKRWPQITEAYLCGHSAGAHLAAMTLCTDWSEYGVTPNFKGAVLVSGVYDLHPITQTYVNQALRMSWEVAQRNSPVQCVAQTKSHAGTCHIVIVVAEHDSPEFHRQSREYFQRLLALGLAVTFTQVGGTDHFDVIERLSQEDYALTQLILEMAMKK